MSACVAFLRGINVGGRAKLPMADLRRVLADAGLGDVRTYLQSGNVVIPEGSRDQARRMEEAIADAFGLDVRVVVRTADELATVLATNPFLDVEAEPTKLHAVFLEREPDPDRVSQLDARRSPPDTFRVVGREIFVRYPNGSGRSKLTLDYFERTLGIAGTARNWNTVTKVLAMTAG